MDLSFIIPHKEIDRSRQKNACKILEYYRVTFPDSEIILIEQDVRPKFKECKLLSQFKIHYTFIYNEGVFNKAWSLNVAAKMVKGNIFVFVDTDIISSKEAIEMSGNLINTEVANVITPYGKFYDLSEPVTKKFHKNIEFKRNDEHQLRFFPDHPMVNVGGICICDSKTFFALHGYNENFRGWGAEDEEFIIRAEKAGYTWKILDEFSIYHLYHLRDVHSTPQHQGYKGNIDTLQRIRDMNSKELKLYIERLPFGDLDKYKS